MLLPRDARPQQIKELKVSSKDLEDAIENSVTEKLNNMGLVSDEDFQSEDDTKLESDKNIREIDDRDAVASPGADPGDIMAHKLEDVIPQRPSPIKIQEADKPIVKDPIGGNPQSEQASWGQDMNTNSGETSDGLIEIDMTTMGQMPGVLSMLGPQMDQNNGGVLGEDVIEIDVLPDGSMTMEMNGGDSPLSGHPTIGMSGNGDVLEEIWVSDDNSSPPEKEPGVPSFLTDMENGLDYVAESLGGMMKGMIQGLPIFSQATETQLTVDNGTCDAIYIDDVKYPNGTPTATLPSVTPIADILDISNSTVTMTDAEKKEGWKGTGTIIGSIALGLVAMILVVLLIGFVIAKCVSKIKARRRGYKEVQERLSSNEEWS